MEQPKVERTLRLMQLMSGNVFLTVEQLAERLDTSSRSIYRYIDSFKASGFAVEKVEGSIYRLVRMPTGYKDLRNLVYFSEEEARVLTYLIESLDETNSLKSSLYIEHARNYWKVLKHRLKKEGNESVTNCNQLKLRAFDGKSYKTDVADTEQLFPAFGKNIF